MSAATFYFRLNGCLSHFSESKSDMGTPSAKIPHSVEFAFDTRQE